jgi:hypothetical protein
MIDETLNTIKTVINTTDNKISAEVSGGLISLKERTLSKKPCKMTINTTTGRNDFNSWRVTLLSLRRLNVQNCTSDTRSNVMLNNRKQMAEGNETGIILLPYRSGALYRYPIKRTDDTSPVNNEKLPLMCLVILVLYGRIPKILTHTKINKTEDIGDIRPVCTLPNISGFLTSIYSTSQAKLKRYSRKIIPQ